MESSKIRLTHGRMNREVPITYEVYISIVIWDPDHAVVGYALTKYAHPDQSFTIKVRLTRYDTELGEICTKCELSARNSYNLHDSFPSFSAGLYTLFPSGQYLAFST